MAPKRAAVTETRAVTDTVTEDAFSEMPPEDAAKLAAAIGQAQAAMKEDVTPPEHDLPADTYVDLPGGVSSRGNDLILSAEVRELTGADEEKLASASRAKPGNLMHFLNVLLECGVVRFGSENPTVTRKLLSQALIGDRDALLLGIRTATYGEDIEVEYWTCPSCEEQSNLVIPVADIPVRKLEDRTFDVPLRKDKTATVRLATGADQQAVYADPGATVAQQDTILLSRCITSITDGDGTVHSTVGNGIAFAKAMNTADRHAILRELRDRQPGPQLTSMKITHELCGEEVELRLSILDLFPGIVVV